MIVVIGGIKGGSGKTTLATNLTVLRANQGKKLLLVDADEQRSTSLWAQQREMQGFPSSWVTIQLSGMNVRSQIQKLAKDYDDIIVDVGGRDTTTQRSALTCADIYLLPFQPRSFDVWTAGPVKGMIGEIMTVNEKLKTYAVINRGDYIGNDNSEAIQILQDPPNSIQTLPCIIGQRKIFANAASEGLVIVEMRIIDKKANLEIQELYKLVFRDT